MQQEREARERPPGDRRVGATYDNMGCGCVRAAIIWRKDRPQQGMERGGLLDAVRRLGRPRHRQGVSLGERSQPLRHCCGELARCRRPYRAQRHDAARQREKVLDAVIHLSEEKVLLLFRAPAFGDVTRDLGCADHLACAISDRRHRQGYLDKAPVLAPADGLVVVDLFAPSKPGEDVGLLIGSIQRDEHGDRAADGFFGGIAEKPLGAAVAESVIVPLRSFARMASSDHSTIAATRCAASSATAASD